MSRGFEESIELVEESRVSFSPIRIQFYRKCSIIFCINVQANVVMWL